MVRGKGKRKKVEDVIIRNMRNVGVSKEDSEVKWKYRSYKD